MALPDYFKIGQGTAVIWGDASATGGSLTVTHALTLDALAAAAGRQSIVADLGALWDEEQALMLKIETGTAPVAGAFFVLYMACSHDNVNFAGGVSGSDAAFTVANRPQLGEPAIALEMPNTANTAFKSDWKIWRPSARYVVAVVINDTAQAIRNLTPDSDNLSRVVMVPRKFSIED